MRANFSKNTDDIKWLKDTALRGVELGQYADFSSYVLNGNEDCPDSVLLFNTPDPAYDESHARVTFVYDLIYCTIDYY